MRGSASERPRRLSHRLRVGIAAGAAIGAFFVLVAALADRFPSRAALRGGWEPTPLETAAPLAGGLLTGALLALLWPARARKATALAAGLAAGIPLGAAVVVSVSGRATAGPVELAAAAGIVLAVGLSLGRFIYDYDRPDERDRN